MDGGSRTSAFKVKAPASPPAKSLAGARQRCSNARPTGAAPSSAAICRSHGWTGARNPEIGTRGSRGHARSLSAPAGCGRRGLQGLGPRLAHRGAPLPHQPRKQISGPDAGQHHAPPYATTYETAAPKAAHQRWPPARRRDQLPPPLDTRAGEGRGRAKLPPTIVLAGKVKTTAPCPVRFRWRSVTRVCACERTRQPL